MPASTSPLVIEANEASLRRGPARPARRSRPSPRGPGGLGGEGRLDVVHDREGSYSTTIASTARCAVRGVDGGDGGDTSPSNRTTSGRTACGPARTDRSARRVRRPGSARRTRRACARAADTSRRTMRPWAMTRVLERGGEHAGECQVGGVPGAPRDLGRPIGPDERRHAAHHCGWRGSARTAVRRSLSRRSGSSTCWAG